MRAASAIMQTLFDSPLATALEVPDMGIVTVLSRQEPSTLGKSDLWADALWQRFGRMRSIALGNDVFDGRMIQGDLDYLSLCRVMATRHRVERTPDLINRNEPAYLKALIQLQGSCCFEQGTQRLELKPGDVVIYGTATAYSVTNPELVEQVMVLIPADKIQLFKSGDRHFTARKLSARAGVGRLVVGLIQSTLEELTECSDSSATDIADSICRLIQDVALEQLDQPGAISLREVMRGRIQSYVERHLGDPNLSIEQIAIRLKCSKRYLYQVFDASDPPLLRYIWSRRLVRAREDLLNVEKRQESVTTIALTWGFSSPNHFGKLFKKEFGMTPSQCREQNPADSCSLTT